MVQAVVDPVAGPVGLDDTARPARPFRTHPPSAPVVIAQAPAVSAPAPAALTALVLPDAESPALLHLAGRLAHALQRRGLLAVLHPEPAGHAARDRFRGWLTALGVGALVQVGEPARSERPSRQLQTSLTGGIPVYGVRFGAEESTELTFCVDDELAADQVLGHLRGLGHTEIGCLLDAPGNPAATGRESTYRARGVRRVNRAASATPEGVRAATGALLEAGCTAVVCGSDLLALGALAALRDRGLNAPRDVSLISLADSPPGRFAEPTLTVLQPPVEQMAESVAEVLREALVDAPAPRLRLLGASELRYAPDLVVRGSTGPAPRGGRAC
jgi:DNA-binding LacI/PurR family transcriptional regulator